MSQAGGWESFDVIYWEAGDYLRWQFVIIVVRSHCSISTFLQNIYIGPSHKHCPKPGKGITYNNLKSAFMGNTLWVVVSWLKSHAAERDKVLSSLKNGNDESNATLLKRIVSFNFASFVYLWNLSHCERISPNELKPVNFKPLYTVCFHFYTSFFIMYIRN